MLQQLHEITPDTNSTIGINSKKIIFIIEKHNGYIASLQFGGIEQNIYELVDFVKQFHNGTITAIKVIINNEPSDWKNVDIKCSTQNTYTIH